MYKQQSFYSYERSCRGTAPTHMLSGAQIWTPCDWKSFMSNNKNNTQFISILLDQLTTDKYATRLVDRNLSHVIDEDMFCLSCKDARLLPNIQEEADTCTMIKLHYLNIRISLPDASTIIVTSKVTRHRCINTTCMILQGYTLDRFVQHWCGQQRRLLNINNIGQNMGGGGGEICTVIHCFTGCDTTSVFVPQKGSFY